MDKNAVSIDLSMSGAICLVKTKAHHYAPLLSWITNRLAFIQWAGPFVEQTTVPSELEISLQKGNYQSFTLVKIAGEVEQILGFGQIQIWPSRAHLGRLIIAPEHRKHGLSYVLVNQLMSEAARQQTIQSVSLFVYNNNIAAKTSYENLGFVPNIYPKEITHVPNCTFMTLDY